MLTVSQADRSNFSEIGSFYSELGYSARLHPSDIVIVARENSEIVGAVRLCSEFGSMVLRGMYVSENKRMLGVGSALLDAASLEIASQECWCIPYTHLCGFYERAGFKEAQPASAPPFLAARCEEYLAKGKSVLIMAKRITAQRGVQ